MSIFHRPIVRHTSKIFRYKAELTLLLATNAIEATIASGIRSVFCYAPTAKTQDWTPEITINGGLLDDWVIEQFEKLGAAAPFGDGRVQMGFAFDGFMLPQDQVVSIYHKARKLGARVITTHYAGLYFGELNQGIYWDQPWNMLNL